LRGNARTHHARSGHFAESGFSSFSKRETIMQKELPSQRPHPTVTVEVGDRCEEIDVEIAPLIELLWWMDIETMMSCQETDPGMAWIEFDSVDDLLRFLNLIIWYEPEPDSLYARVNWQRFSGNEPGTWEYQFNLMDVLEDDEEQTVEGTACFTPTIGVYFPKSDIPELINRLKARLSVGANA